MVPQFIEVSGVVINTKRISFVDFRQEGKATVHLDGNSITTEGAEAEGLRRFFRPAQPEQWADSPAQPEQTEAQPETKSE